MRVEPDGPIPCKYMLLGEAPGADEQLHGHNFVGKSGQQLWSDLKRVTGFERSAFYVTNVYKSGLPNNRDPNQKEIGGALPELYEELDRVRPRLVITAGAVATRVFLSRPLSDVHGIPHHVKIAGHSLDVMPIYHPAAGLHNKGFLAAFEYDLKKLKEFLEHSIASRVFRPPVFRVKWANSSSFPQTIGIIAVDTEGWADKPWGLSFSINGETGYVIRATDKRLLSQFNAWFDLPSRSRVVLHNGLHDLPVLAAMGISIDRWDDTQVLAYHDMIRTGSGVLEAESQNLGTLAYRYCRLELKELKDLVGVDFSTQTIPYTDEVRDYAGMDVIATWRLYQHYQMLTSNQAYRLDMGQVPLVRAMMNHGLPIDDDAAIMFYLEVLDKFVAAKVALKLMASDHGLHNFNPRSHPQVREVLGRIGLYIHKRTKKGGLPSTSEKALVAHAGNAFVKELQTFRELDKLRGTYLFPLLEEISSE